MRAGAYVRVSSKDQAEGYSLDSQLRLIQDYCRGQGWDAPTVFADEGVSAFTDDLTKRPAFLRLLEAAERREVQVVVILDVDRFARSALTALAAKDRLNRAGAAFISLFQPYDFDTPDGRLLFTINSGLAEYASRQISRKSRLGIAEARRRGMMFGPRPFGARREGVRWVVDEDRAADLRLLLELAATESDAVVANELNRRGIRPLHVDRWHKDVIASLVRRRGGWLLAQPEPWPTLYAAARDRPRLPRLPVGRAARPLSGLARCACGGAVAYERTRMGWHRGRCRWAGRCGYRLLRMEVYEGLVGAWVARLDEHAAEREVAVDGDGAARASLAERRRRVGVRYEVGELSEGEYRGRLAELAALEGALPPTSARREELRAGFAAAQVAWPGAPAAARNALLRILLARVVLDGDGCTLVVRPELAALLPGDAGLPAGQYWLRAQ